MVRGALWRMVVALALAGCAAPLAEPPNGGPPGDAVASVESSFQPTLIGKGGHYEASLAIGPDGTILVCSHAAFRGPVPLWVSRDGGSSFQEVTTGETAGSGDCDVAAGPDAWYVVYTTGIRQGTPGPTLTLPGTGLRLAMSRDQGESWSVTAPVPATNLHDRPWINVANDIVDVVYLPSRPVGLRCVDPVCAGADSVFLVRSTDAGRTWGTPILAYAAPRSGLVVGHPVLSGDGRHIGFPMQVLTSTDNSERLIVYATSADGGETWTSSQIDTRANGLLTFPSAAIGPDGRVVVAYALGTPQAATILLATSTDGGQSWSEPFEVTRNASFDPTAAVGGAFASVAVALGEDGVATLGWLDARQEDGSPVWSLHAASVPLDPDPRLRSEGRAATPAPGQWPSGLEFIQAREAPDGRAILAYPWNGAACAPEREADESSVCIMLLAERP